MLSELQVSVISLFPPQWHDTMTLFGGGKKCYGVALSSVES